MPNKAVFHNFAIFFGELHHWGDMSEVLSAGCAIKVQEELRQDAYLVDVRC